MFARFKRWLERTKAEGDATARLLADERGLTPRTHAHDHEDGASHDHDHDHDHDHQH